MTDAIGAAEEVGGEAQEFDFESELEALGEAPEPEDEGIQEPAKGEREPAQQPGETKPGQEDKAGEPGEPPGDLRVALREARAMHRKDVEQLHTSYEQKFNILMGRVVELLKGAQPAPEGAKAPSLDEDPEGFIRHAVDEAIRPVLERAEREDAEGEEETLRQLSEDTRAFVDADWKQGIEKHGEETLMAAVNHVVGEELRTIRSRWPQATPEQVATHFLGVVLPDMQFRYALAGQSLTEMAIERARDAGALPAPGEPPARPAAAASKPPGGRVAAANKAKPSLSAVSGAAAKGKATRREIDNSSPEEYAALVAEMGFGDILSLYAERIE